MLDSKDSKDSKPNSIIDARSSRGSRIEDRVSILDSKETVNLHLPGTVLKKSGSINYGASDVI